MVNLNSIQRENLMELRKPTMIYAQKQQEQNQRTQIIFKNSWKWYLVYLRVKEVMPFPNEAYYMLIDMCIWILHMYIVYVYEYCDG